MKLVLIYGPSAVGKLTVAQELSRQTGLNLFHNHLTVDLVEPIFPRGTPSFGKLIWEIRLAVLAEAVQTGLDGLVFTMVYGRGREDSMARCIDLVERGGGQACLVHLHCAAATLRQRVGDEGRKQYGKITSVEVHDQWLLRAEDDLPFAAATRWQSLSLDTGELDPIAAAQKIIDHYQLT
ncbi:MAG: AAA family ATPase [Candidatus Latescibacteria bacterium]|nr:AAA family ATPase [Candidatus Latescibacterota bacterium]